MIDRIIQVDSDNSAIGIKNITFNEPMFRGHFPRQSGVPGVLIIGHGADGRRDRYCGGGDEYPAWRYTAE